MVGRPRDQRRAGGEGRPYFLDGEIEGQRHALVNAVSRPNAVDRRAGSKEVANAGVVDRHALGMTGRARGVDDVAQGVAGFRGGVPRRLPLRLFAHKERGGAGVEEKHGTADGGERGTEAGRGRQQSETGVARDEGDSLRRKRRIEGDEGGPTAENGEKRDVRMNGAFEQQADAVAGPDAAADQAPGQLTDLGIKSRVGQLLPTADESEGVGSCAASALKKVMQPGR